MHIVMFSMTPLFRDKSMGGAQKQLKKVGLHLAQEGHQVTILCTMREDAAEAFNWHDNLRVIPIYRFKQPFPEPYATPVYNIAAAIQDTGEYLASADRFYSHDGGLIFPYIYQDIPTVISLRSILFSETLQSGYLFQGDALIVPSEHTAEGWINTVGRFFPGFSERVHVIHNGLDFDHYTPVTSSHAASDALPDIPDHQHVILYPHRPEEAKGIRQTIEVVDRLVHYYGINDLRVLLPQWIDTGVSADVRGFYQALEDDIERRGLYKHFVFHDWIGDAMMPAYYRRGDLTLALGHYVETFGNTPYESLACGTPVLAARVGPYREMLPEHLLVDYGDISAAAEKAARIIVNKSKPSEATMRWLHDNFQQSDMVKAYADVILNAEKRPPLSYHCTPIDDSTQFKLAPWCYITEQGIYHDFLGTYRDDDALVQFVTRRGNRIRFADATEEQLMNWYRDGYLVPLQGQDI